MDFGHYNCRDYYISLRSSANITVKDRYLFDKPRHESFDDLERRCRSPASLKPKFPLLRLPLELRQQIFNYLLPRTLTHTDHSPLANNAHNLSSGKNCGERGMITSRPRMQRGPGHVVWRRGNINLLCVCRQLHEECAELLYGNNTFLLFVTYSGTTFRFSWLLPTGTAPSRQFKILELLPKRYLALIKRVIVNVDHVDSYTGMVKFNVSGNGLIHGLRNQVQHLVNALGPVTDASNIENGHDDYGHVPILKSEVRRLAKIYIRVSGSSAGIDKLRNDAIRRREGTKAFKDVEQILGPFGVLRGVREVTISGAVTDDLATSLEQKMKSMDDTAMPLQLMCATKDPYGMSPLQLCVYGNDI